MKDLSLFWKKNELQHRGVSLLIAFLCVPSIWLSQNDLSQWKFLRKTTQVFTSEYLGWWKNFTTKNCIKCSICTFSKNFFDRFVNFYLFSVFLENQFFCQKSKWIFFERNRLHLSKSPKYFRKNPLFGFESQKGFTSIYKQAWFMSNSGFWTRLF